VSLPVAALEKIVHQLVVELQEETDLERDQESSLSIDHASRKFTKLFATAPVGIALADPLGFIVNTNAALDKILGYSAGALIGRRITDLGASEHDQTALRDGLNELNSKKLERYHHLVLLERDGDAPLWAQTTLTQLPGDGADSENPVLMVLDSDEIHLLQETIRHQSVHDPLTGLPNSAQFTTKLEALLASGANTGEQIALVYLDIDGFKVINDGLGAGAADKVLRAVARKITSVVTEHVGFVARASGDGFAILLTGPPDALNASDVISIVERIFQELGEPTYHDGHGIGISASAGIVVRAITEVDSTDMLRAAEITLHRAKEAGKAQWMLFDPALDLRDRNRYQLAAVIAGALENGEFSLIYQPTIKLANPHQLAAVNAGLQWSHPAFESLEEKEFFRLAEKTGMTIPLGRWLLTESLAATARWRDTFSDAAPDVCVRLPKRLATEPDLVLLVKEQLDLHRLPAKALRLCTEGSSLIDAQGEVVESLMVLSELGAQLVLAVSGSADLELIPQHNLPVKHVVLTGPVVDAVSPGAGPDDPGIRHISQLIQRARELKLRIGAEGVTTRAQAIKLRELGVIAARGAFVAESATGDEVHQMIERHADW
jgi:diguanylate cyclase (GGDEF)-like protein/PAS domain S-box-containing protein